MKEEEIRKRDLFNRYLELVEKDIKDLFIFEDFESVPCPACNGDRFREEFVKTGFAYVACKQCSTLFANPRPSFRMLKKFYAKSRSTSFWVNEFFRSVAETRREKIFKPRAEYARSILEREKEWTIGDIGAGFGIFLEELSHLLPHSAFVAIEPSVEMAAICKDKGFAVQCACLEDIQHMEEEFDFLSAFELLEHLHTPSGFLKKAKALLKPGGYLLLTTLNGSGFDIQLLWEKSKSISPPHHLNFFNIPSVGCLLNKIGFDIVEISTPGRLDWDIVEGMIKTEGLHVSRFWNFLADIGTESCKRELQDWISRNGLSSHMSVLARRPS
ncbi:MAG: class I SAM-dependent methyltransferase [Pseudomonadota bacterium]